MSYEGKSLYKVSVSTKKMQEWKGWVEGATVVFSYGQLGGKHQVHKYQAISKNIGKVNETSPEEQARLELEAKYKAQIENAHYRVTQALAQEFVDSNREPRKILDYKKGWKGMSDTLLTSIKKNGSRACVLQGVLHSKIGKPEEIKVDHLREAVDALGGEDFDAEVYAHGLSLQRIRSAWLKPVRTNKEVINMAKKRAKDRDEVLVTESLEAAIEYLGYNPNDDAPKLVFDIFDIPNTDGVIFEDRVLMMQDLDKKVRALGLSGTFKFIYPFETNSHEGRMKLLDKVTDQGYEGLVHYEPKGEYEFGRRSSNAQKSKKRYDSEAKVISVEEDKNGNGILHCIACDALDNVKFKCVMKVDRRDGKSYPKTYEAMLDLIGKWITFSYEELSDVGKPTKTIGELERECDDSGDPLN